MIIWEYCVIYIPEGSNRTKALNEKGLQGWELVSVISYNAYLKRPLIKS